MASEGYLDCIRRESGNIPPDLDDPPDAGGDGNPGDPPDDGDDCNTATLWKCTKCDNKYKSTHPDTGETACGVPTCIRVGPFDVTSNEFGVENPCFNDCDDTTTDDGFKEGCGDGGGGCRDNCNKLYSSQEACEANCPCLDISCTLYVCPTDTIPPQPPSSLPCSAVVGSLSAYVCGSQSTQCFEDNAIPEDDVCEILAGKDDDCGEDSCGEWPHLDDPQRQGVAIYADSYVNVEFCQGCEEGCSAVPAPCSAYPCSPNEAPCDGEPACPYTEYKEDDPLYDCCLSANDVGQSTCSDGDGNQVTLHKTKQRCIINDTCKQPSGTCTYYVCAQSTGDDAPCNQHWESDSEEGVVRYSMDATSIPETGECCYEIQVDNNDTSCCNCDGTKEDTSDCEVISVDGFDAYKAKVLCMSACSTCPSAWQCDVETTDAPGNCTYDSTSLLEADYDFDTVGSLACSSYPTPSFGDREQQNAKTLCEASDVACLCPVKYYCYDSDGDGIDEDCLQCSADDVTADDCENQYSCGDENTVYYDSCTQASCPQPTDRCWVCPDGQPNPKTCKQLKMCDRDEFGDCPSVCFETQEECNKDSADCIGTKGGPTTPGGPPPPGEGNFNTDRPRVPDQAAGESFGFSYNQLAILYGVNSIRYLKSNSSNVLTSIADRFMSVKSDGLRSDLFKPLVHGPIKAVILMNRGAMPYSDLPYGSISNAQLERSLHNDLVILMKSCKSADGRPIYKQLLQNIKSYILDGKIEEFNVVRFTDTLNRIIEAQKSGDYKETRGNFSFTRKPKEKDAIDLVMRTGKPYSHKNYGERIGERMRLWKTVATDLFKNIPFVKSDGTSTKIPIKKDDSFSFVDSSGTTTSGYINDGDFVNFVNDSGEVIRVEVDGEHERAGIIDLEVMQKALSLLQDDLEFTLTVTTDASARVEEQYNYHDAHRTSYVLKLKPNTIKDLPRKNQFVSRTSAEYLFETGRQKHTDWIKYKPFPYLVIYVDHEDPIVSFFNYANTITFTTKDFTLDTVDDGSMPLYPRRLPWTLIVIPTDRSDLTIYGGKSKYIDYGTRELSIKIHPDPSKSKTGLEGPHLKTSFASDGRGVAENRNAQALEYSYDLDRLRSMVRYEVTPDNTELLPRRKGAVRTVLETLRDFTEYYIVNDSSRVTWEEVYDKIPNANMKKLYRECLDWMNLKTKLTMGNVSDNEDVDTLYARPLDILGRGATTETQRKFSQYDTGIKINVEKIDNPDDIPEGPELPEATPD